MQSTRNVATRSLGGGCERACCRCPGALFLTVVLTLFADLLQAADLLPPQRVILQMSQEARTAVQNEGERLEREPERLRYWVERIIFTRVDFETMSRFVLGPYWRRATPEQQGRFVREFRMLLISTYTAAYKQFGDWHLHFMPLGEAAAARRNVVVRTKIELVGGPVANVDFRMIHSRGSWRIFDVAIEGVSLVANFRTTFAHEVRQRGIEGLLEKMSAHNAGAADKLSG